MMETMETRFFSIAAIAAPLARSHPIWLVLTLLCSRPALPQKARKWPGYIHHDNYPLVV